MSKLIHNKFFLIYIILGGILLSILLAIIYLRFENATAPSPSSPTTPNQISPLPSVTGTAVTNIEVDKVIPDDELGLTSGKPHSFFIHFNGPISVNQISCVVTYTYIYTDDPIPQIASITTNQLGKDTLELQVLDPIEQGAEYTIVIRNRSTNDILSTTTYSSQDVQPTPIQKNNPALKQYLPYTTSTYSLEYLERKNIYQFHFIYNPDVETPIEEQFETAKTDALQFIRSHSIDPASVTIEWKYY